MKSNIGIDWMIMGNIVLGHGKMPLGLRGIDLSLILGMICWLGGAKCMLPCTGGDMPFTSWKILYFWQSNCAIWWILLGANLEQGMKKKKVLHMYRTNQPKILHFFENFWFKLCSNHWKSVLFLAKVYWFWLKSFESRSEYFQNIKVWKRSSEKLESFFFIINHNILRNLGGGQLHRPGQPRSNVGIYPLMIPRDLYAYIYLCGRVCGSGAKT